MKRRLFAMLFEIFLVEHAVLLTQSPTGTIVGIVIGSAGPVITGAYITIVNRDTGLAAHT